MQWDAKQYDTQHDFVFEYGQSLLAEMPEAPGKVLDIGCGTGELSQKLAEDGFDVSGIDQSEAMLEVAHAHFPAVQFILGDILNYGGKAAQYDCLFSNACFHWIRAQDRLANVMHRLLRPSGMLVAEFGGQGNIQQIQTAVDAALAKRGLQKTAPFYFPSVDEYRDLLERHGFADVKLKLYPRPTPLKAGDAGLRQWIKQFFETAMAQVPDAEQPAFFAEVEAALRPQLWRTDHWVADYWRLRVKATA